MNNRSVVAFGVMVLLTVAASSPSLGQSFQNYRCADGSQFILGVFENDSRAYLQIDGGAVVLAKRLALSGLRYSGSGVTLMIARSGITTLKHARRPATACDAT